MIEILIAMFIFAIIITTVFGSYRGTAEQIERVSKDRYLVEMGRNCIDRITRDLLAVWVVQSPEYQPPGINSDPDPYRVAGEDDSVDNLSYTRLQFTSLAHLPIRPSRSFGIARIVYYVQSDENGMHRLFRSDRLFPYGRFEEDPMDPVLCTHVHALSFTFYDSDGEPHEEWNSESESVKYATPAAVEIRLELGDGESTQIFKTRVNLPVRREKIENGV
ncbi:MAG: hypothetical protein DSY89_06970 [Deltaproteobacteria bacterium]|nr:MAG: hypothetical protein DSY89_06970 [Deltaproteobacteria bacterium]